MRHNLIGIWQIASYILHLSRVRVTDFVISPPIVGTFNHDDICPWTAELYGVALTGQLSADHSHRDWGAAESYRKEEKKVKCSSSHTREKCMCLLFRCLGSKLISRNERVAIHNFNLNRISPTLVTSQIYFILTIVFFYLGSFKNFFYKTALWIF